MRKNSDARFIPYICAALLGLMWLSIVNELTTGSSYYEYGISDIITALLFVGVVWSWNRLHAASENTNKK